MANLIQSRALRRIPVVLLGALGPGRGGAGLDDLSRSMDRSRADADGDGIVTRAEFEGISADWFARRDRDGDGYITEADFGPRG